MHPSEQIKELSQAQEFLTRMQDPEFRDNPEKILTEAQQEMRRTEAFEVLLPGRSDPRPPILVLRYEDESEAHLVLTGLRLTAPLY